MPDRRSDASRGHTPPHARRSFDTGPGSRIALCSRRARTRHVLPLAVLLLALPAPAPAFELGALFRTPEQRAAARAAAGEHEALIEEAPDARWEGIGRYGAGDAAGAAEAFARALADGEPGVAERDTLLFNRATAETRAGRLDEALALYDELLERDPTHADALHNREIARALKALERGEGQSGEGGEEGDGESESGAGGDGDGGDRRDEASSETDSPSADDAESGESGESGESADARTGESEAENASADARTEEERRAAAQEASEALAAERGRDGAEEPTEEGERRAMSTPSEREQATEQWLRRIPDDPAGLLRSRLQRSHREHYPEVGDGAEPW